jgi:hypothetical protein
VRHESGFCRGCRSSSEAGATVIIDRMTLRGGIDLAFLIAGALMLIGWRANDYRVRWRTRPDPMPPGLVIVALFALVYGAVALDAVRQFT